MLQFGSETWQVWEAHWAQSFHPLRSFRVLTWGFRILRDHSLSSLKGLFPGLRGKLTTTADEEDPVYRRVPRSRWTRLYDPLVGILALLVFMVAYPLSLALGSIFFVLRNRCAVKLPRSPLESIAEYQI